MRFLVTGGAGFIASHITDRLVGEKYDVTIVDNLSTGQQANLNPRAKLYEADIRDAAALKKIFAAERPEFLCHHAAQTDVRRSMGEPDLDAQMNIVGFINLLELCVQYKVKKVVFASSSAIYPEPLYVPVDEKHPIRPLCAYGLSKYVGEQYLAYYGEVYDLPFTIFRYGNVYGPRQDPKGECGVVAIFADQLLSSVRPTIFGDGSKTRDYVHVDDVASANLLALHGGGNGEVFNIGWGEEVSDFRVFDSIRPALNVSLAPIYANKRAGELDRIALDCSKAATVLGWKPAVNFHDGIAQTVEYYRELHEGMGMSAAS